jgi:uncharacterized protein YfaS (alpha-2-macroglobulin family)
LAIAILMFSAAGRALYRNSQANNEPPQASNWGEVERLISDQKMQEALSLAEKLRVAAQKAGDRDEWTRALIKEVQLHTALHGYETSVRLLKEQPWPEGLLQRAALNLFYAQSLVNYYSAYSYEVNRREKVESANAVDLQKWTKDQIYAEAQKTYQEVWTQREALGKEPSERLSEYLKRNNYPKGIRDTLRDAVTYLYVDLLSNTSLWSPAESNELYRLDLKAIVAGGQAARGDAALLDPAIHPLMKAGALLGDLESWHKQNGRREAALEARLERLRRLHKSFSEPADRAIILADLDQVLNSYRDVPWWAAGKAAQAEFMRDGDDPGRLIRARAVANEGAKAFPNSIGGRICLDIVRSIDAPDFQLTSMSSDGPRKRSIEVSHRNLAALYFRAYAYDLGERVRTGRDYNLLPDYRELSSILKTGKPVVEWREDLPATRDFQTHRTFVTPPIPDPGSYAVVASINRDFSEKGNLVAAVNLIVSDLVLITSVEPQADFEVRSLSGGTGKPMPGTTVTLYNWQNGRSKVDERLTNQEGIVRFPGSVSSTNPLFFLFARNGPHVALEPRFYFYGNAGTESHTPALLYTDRSIYRPLQKILWKVLIYTANSDKNGYRALPATPTTITLFDPNHQKVEERIVISNDFGSAAGEFTIPTGHLLGTWYIQSRVRGETAGNSAAIRVEEYKRPTFEVALTEPKSALRLNQSAVLEGEVKYYFGLPVTNGLAKWRVTREPVYPVWWSWDGGRASASSQTVASGTAPLKQDGKFELSFLPQADERLAARSRDITYRYHLTADVTDEGGETRSASKSFRLGFVAVEAFISAKAGFFRQEVSGAFEIERTDLNNVPRVGRGSWRLVTLRQPPVTPLPADIPIDPPDSGQKIETSYRTPGDALRPRWNPQYDFRYVLHRWLDGPEAGHGELSHDVHGQAGLVLPVLPAGAYRIYYETVDDFGARYQTFTEFVVAGPRTSFALPALLIAENDSQPVGSTARFLAVSGLPDQACYFEIYRSGHLVSRRTLVSGRDPALIEIPVREEDRGGFSARLSLVRDHQFMRVEHAVVIPWDNKELKVEFATFRDKLQPGSKETWRVTIKSPSGANVEAGAAELLAYMYDRSLDTFAPHHPPNPLDIYYRAGFGTGMIQVTLGQSWAQVLANDQSRRTPAPPLQGDQLSFYDSYGIGGPGRRGYGGVLVGGAMGGRGGGGLPPAAPSPPRSAVFGNMDANLRIDGIAADEIRQQVALTEPPVTLRSEFAETAFWRPQLLTGADGSATIEFTVPDSVTSWNVWVHAVTRDLMGGSLHQETRSVKDLMVRPYVPRFLREGDKAELKVVVNNASGRELSGKVAFDILDPETEESLLKSFGLQAGEGTRSFTAAAGGGANVSFPIVVPAKVGQVAFKVTAVSGDVSDGELRPMPILPGRMHLMQSRFVTLKNKDRREMTFDDLKAGNDPTRLNEQMVVTLDAQLFYSVLSALPYLVNYPYECTEQTLNRFVSTGILSGLYQNYPSVAKMAAEFSKRDTPLETWDAADPNRKMALEETPWLADARGGKNADPDVVNILDPRIAKAEQESALAKLRKAQTANGAFPWWPGGPPSPYMTLYIMYGFAKASEFGVDVPKEVVQRGWEYLALHFRDEYAGKMIDRNCCWEFLTFLNYVASCYPDSSWTKDALTAQQRKDILDFTFKHWKEHSPYLKCQLALTLKRMGRPQDAALVFASVMDSARSAQDQGTFWAPEDEAWLWYNDTIETHAFALRTLMELAPNDGRKDGLLQWLFLNKKLNHWKSTRATAEVIYSLVHYLKNEGALGTREDATVHAGGQSVQYLFEPDQYTGKKNQTIITGDKLDSTYATVTVEKESPGFVFASATWQFSTEQLPEQGSGDFLSVSRTYFKRETMVGETVLKPLAEGVVLQPGDEVEVHLSIRAKHPCEYMHLRDPRAAGLEPENAVSRYRWDQGIGWYEEVRDSGTNFFFEQLPQGEYTFKYRLRANMTGTFKVSPATLQSMYAPEFTAYSSGAMLTIR